MFLRHGEATERFLFLGPYCNVFQAEVYAMLACARRNIEEGLVNKTILIRLDSLTALFVVKGY